MPNHTAIQHKILNAENTTKSITLNKIQKHFIANQIKPLKKISIPTLKYSIEADELVAYLFEKLNNAELQEICTMIRIAKKRSADIRPLIATIALSLLEAKKR